MREYWLDPPAQDEDPICPVCGESCAEYFFDANNEICGCENCISRRDAWEYKGEQDALQADYYREVFMSDR